jgi:hypothetical protein
MQRTPYTAGFSLIQISILLTVASLVIVAVLPSTQSKISLDATNTTKMNAIIAALRQYQAATCSLPCPADPTLPMGDNNWGRAAANSGTGSPGNCIGGTPAAAYADTTQHIAIGMVPVFTLGLSYDYALDGWRRDITYAVDTGATNNSAGSASITINNYGNIHNSVVALVSHGQDGFGAWLPLAGNSGTATRLNNGSTDTGQSANAQVTSDGHMTNLASFATFVNQQQTSTFDDHVVYSSTQWNINALPVATIVTLTPPANGSYSTGQVLTFTITSRSNITVTGTPRLALSALGTGKLGNGVAPYISYATYTSGSGTNSITFTYTVQSGDSAPTSGISLASGVDLNGGTATVSPCLPFTVPDLSGVLINPVTLYIADQAHNKIYSSPTSGTLTWTSVPAPSGPSPGINSLAIDGSGNLFAAGGTSTYIYKYNGGSWSTFTTSVSSPVAQAIDYNNGNVWVSNYGANNVKKFPSTGGSGTSYSDSFSAPQAIWVDASSNVWVSDGNNNCIKKYNGSSWTTYGSAGTTAGKFNSPVGVYVDAAGSYVWIADTGNNRIQKCTINFSSCTTFGGTATGTAAGQFNSPLTVRGDANGILWVDDSGNNRIQKYDGTTWTIVGSTPAGASIWDALPVPIGTR